MSQQQYDTCTRRERGGCLAFEEFICLSGKCTAWTDDPYWKVKYYQDAAAYGYDVEMPNLRGGVAKMDLDAVRLTLTRDEYLQLVKEGKTDRQIFESKGIDKLVFNTLKKEWGLLDLARERLSKDAYLALSQEGKTDRQIFEERDIDKSIFYAIKREWGLTAAQQPPASFQDEVAGMMQQLNGGEHRVPDAYKLEGTAEAITKLNSIVTALDELDSLICSVRSVLINEALNNYRNTLMERISSCIT